MFSVRKMSQIRKIPPLPFQGNKSLGRKKFLEFLNKIDNGNDMVFVDLFGGSFYLSYLVHQMFPKAKVICNDYDNYMERLQNIKKTNELLTQIRVILKDSEKSKRVSDKVQNQIYEFLNEQTGYVDWMTLSASLLYSVKYDSSKEEFLKRYYWNILRNNLYDEDISDYINGIEFVRLDWEELYNQYKDTKNVIFLADPPYCMTNNSGYVGSDWTLRDSLKTLVILKSSRFCYYASTKSGLVEIIEFMKEQGMEINDYESIAYKRGMLYKYIKQNKEVILYKCN